MDGAFDVDQDSPPHDAPAYYRLCDATPAANYGQAGTLLQNTIGGNSIDTSALPQRSSAFRSIKRIVDLAGSIVGLILFAPLMVMIAALIARQKGPIIFRHERIGFNGARFPCLKFRTMAPDAEARLQSLLQSDPEARAEWARDHKLRHDPRITRLGAFLRKTSLDELPQFFNVLFGEMSLVGPRPITEKEIAKYKDDFSYYKSCRPGITGLWQVSGRNDISYAARVTLDTQYALNKSVLGDFNIMLKTVGVVLSKTGAH